MNILLDTHILLWSLTEDSKLSQKAIDIISNNDNKLYYSIASVWEIEIKNSLGKMPITGEEFCVYCKESGYDLLEIKEKHIFNLKSLTRMEDAPKHNDPFDRIMISQAKSEGLQFVTHDSLLADYGENCIMIV